MALPLSILFQNARGQKWKQEQSSTSGEINSIGVAIESHAKDQEEKYASGATTASLPPVPVYLLSRRSLTHYNSHGAD